jgi:hypothetical protein
MARRLLVLLHDKVGSRRLELAASSRIFSASAQSRCKPNPRPPVAFFAYPLSNHSHCDPFALEAQPVL